MDPRLAAFERLLNTMDDLREKCPWDKKQTLESLRHLTIEETYELADAITDNDLKALEGEIGDLFLHMVFYCKIGQEKNAFDVTTVLNSICDKLVHRHPHIYGDVEATTEEEVKENWEKLKLKEGKESVLEGVPNSLPALVKATRIQEKAKGIGFEWEKRRSRGTDPPFPDDELCRRGQRGDDGRRLLHPVSRLYESRRCALSGREYAHHRRPFLARTRGQPGRKLPGRGRSALSAHRPQPRRAAPTGSDDGRSRRDAF